MEAQRADATRFLAPRGQLSGNFEVESGKKHTNRPQLTAAIAECRKHRAVLVIGKLDRLARNVHFISGLMDSDVEFVAVDMPSANRLTIHILAAVAEHERGMISQRTKAALAVAKARGTKLGNPRAVEAAVIARAAKKLPKPEPEVLDLAVRMKSQGKGLRAIARELNRLKIRTPLGFQWHPWTVKNQLLQGA